MTKSLGKKKKYKNENEIRLAKNQASARWRKRNPLRTKQISKAYRENNKEKRAEYKRNNPEKNRIYAKKYRENNKEKVRAIRARWRKKNKKKIKESSKIYLEKNKERIKQYRIDNYEKISKAAKKKRSTREYKDRQNRYFKNRLKKDINFKIGHTLRKQLNKKLSSQKVYKKNKALELLGININDFKAYIVKKFKPGMTWKNHGKWHIDHIKPVSKFDLTNQEEQKKCFHYTNLQPLWAKENIVKSDKY